jgi:cellulose synthase operon protein B
MKSQFDRLLRAVSLWRSQQFFQPKSRSQPRQSILLVCLVSCTLVLIWGASVQAQSPADDASTKASAATEFTLPQPNPSTVAPLPAGQYVLEFNRSPVIGDRLRLQGVYDEARLQFTRPHSWKPKAAKVSLRFRHSAALYASRSNLTLIVNGSSVGSTPLNKPQGEIGTVVFDLPPDLLQDYNEMVIAGLQNNSPTCTQDPFDPSLWTEILPDSKLVFDFQPQPIPLNFNRYPYPIFDILSLDANEIAYLSPKTIDDDWLTATTRFQTSLGRVAQYRSMHTRLVDSLDQVKETEKLIVIGTPAAQPNLDTLKLPLTLKDNQFLDGKQQVLPPDVGVLMLTTIADDHAPVLVATGNGAEGVAKAVQFLVQSRDRQIGTGQAILINQLAPVSPALPRDWQGYLPTNNSFQLKDLTTFDHQTFKDVTIWGSHSPAIKVDFRALPDDHFLPGNTMTLDYSYGPQVNPLTSLVEVALDGVALGGQRLSSMSGGNHELLKVDLPADHIKPNSKLQVNFRLDPRERRSCSRVTDQQLWGTIHASSSFELQRENVVQMPNLELLQFGFPFAEPQDLSNTTIAVPDSPNTANLQLLLSVGERLGRLSHGDSVKLDVYRVSKIPSEQQKSHHLIAIGTQGQFPFPEVLKTNGFTLGNLSARQWQQSQIQTLPDTEGLVKEVLSPWNHDRVLLALSGQSNVGLLQIQDLLDHDPLFFRLQGDTVLISANSPNPSPYETDDYNLEFLQQSPQRQLVGKDRWNWQLFLRTNWFLLAPALIVVALVMYGVTQLYLKRLIEGIK